MDWVAKVNPGIQHIGKGSEEWTKYHTWSVWKGMRGYSGTTLRDALDAAIQADIKENKT
jgi:hypothetical protein